MSRLVSDIEADIASRLYEDSAPTDANEKARRLRYINQANRYILNKEMWWFTATYSSDTPVATQKIYTLPSAFRSMIDVRVGGELYSALLNTQGFDFETIPLPVYWGENQYYIFNNEITFIPTFDSSDIPSSKSITITSSGTLATATTSSAHGYNAGEFVLIAGATQTEYNGTFRIISIPTTTTFVYSITGSPATPATGTITAILKPIVYHYFKYGETKTSDSDTFLIPDQYTDALSAYVAGRLFQIEGARGKATDNFDEVEEIIKLMRSDKLARAIYQQTIRPNAYNFKNYRY